jgi:hypothetical protein
MLPTLALQSAVATLVDQFAPITLAEMEAVALLNRVDLKFVLTPEQLLAALDPLTERYRVLSVSGVRLNRYRTHYFDTPNFHFYQQHHNGRPNRYKVRLRTYLDSDLSYLEVKRKNHQGRTIKARQRAPATIEQFDAPMVAFLERSQPFAPDALEWKLVNHFIRVTLVSNHAIERLTVDLAIRFETGALTIELPEVIVAELKQTGHARQSDFMQQMRAIYAPELTFSKYCIGAALQYPHLKQNNFKPVFLRLQKLGVTPQHGAMIDQDSA